MFPTVGLGAPFLLGTRAATVVQGLVQAGLCGTLVFGLILIMRKLLPAARRIPMLELVLVGWVPASGLLAGAIRFASAYPEADWLLCLEPALIGAGFPLLLLCAGVLVGRLSGLLPKQSDHTEVPFLHFLLVTNLLGSLALAVGLYLAALLRLWLPVVLWGGCLLVLVAGLLFLFRERGRIVLFQSTDESGEADSSGKSSRFDWREAAMAGALCLILQASFQLATLPPDDSDELRYHLSIPKRYLEHGGAVEIPGQNFAHFPLGLEVLFALPLSLDLLRADEARMGWSCGVKIVHLWYFVLTLILLRVWTRERLVADRRETEGEGDHPQSGLAGLLVLASIPFAPVLGAWAFVEFGAAFGWLASAYFLWRALSSESSEKQCGGPDRKNSILAALAVGWSLAVKYTSLAWWALLLLVLLAVSLQRRRLHPAMICMLILPGLCVSPWLLHNAWTTGNPFAPLLSSVFGGGFDPVQKAFYDWHAGMKGDLNLFRRLPWWEKALDLVLLPFRAVFFPERFENNPLGGLLLALFPAALLGGTARFADPPFPRSRGVGFVAAIAAGVYLLWALTYRDPRFALPLWGILAMGIGLGLSKQAPARESPRFHHHASSFLSLLIVLWSLMQCEELFSRVGRFSSAILLRKTPDAHLTRPDRIPQVATIREVERMRSAHPGGKPSLLLLGQEQSYYFDSPVRGNDYFDGPLLASIAREASSVEAMSESLRRLGADWIWVHRGTLEGNVFNLVRGFIFCLPAEEGLDAMRELAESNPSGLLDAEAWLERATQNEPFRRMHAWLIRHPGYREVPLATVPPGERPICPLAGVMLKRPELKGISAADLPRVSISLLVADSP
ncbi:MAG: hypothetical protein GHCLOJNM_02303 [bacterium]|nr:hypothetical protein [bacterium]